MEWQQLEYFQTVARLQHMTLAAEALAISQPALSRSIARLEQELGVPLFERRGRSIVLNRYGTQFLVRVNRIMQEYEEGRQELQDMLSPEHGEVSLGFLHTLGVNLIPTLIKRFRETHPQVHFQLHENSTQTLLEQLESGAIDLCMASLHGAKVQVQWVKLWSEELFVIVPSDHRLAGRSSIRLEEIADEPLVSFKEGYGLRKTTDDLLHTAGIKPRITFEGDEVHTIAGLVESRLGVALIPNTLGLDRHEVALLKVDWPVCQREINIAWIEGRYMSPVVRQFRQFVIDYFKSGSPL